MEAELRLREAMFAESPIPVEATALAGDENGPPPLEGGPEVYMLKDGETLHEHLTRVMAVEAPKSQLMLHIWSVFCPMA